MIRVIDVPRATGGQILRVLMNADLDEAVGVFAPPQATILDVAELAARGETSSDQHWRWRLRFAERIGACLDADRFGVQALYVIGSTKNATAGPESDIDLLVHFRGSEEQRRDLDEWFEGWSLALAEMNYLRTGYRIDRLLDVHIITDEDIRMRSSHAVKIGAVTDAARPIPLGSAVRSPK